MCRGQSLWYLRKNHPGSLILSLRVDCCGSAQLMSRFTLKSCLREDCAEISLQNYSIFHFFIVREVSCLNKFLIFFDVLGYSSRESETVISQVELVMCKKLSQKIPGIWLTKWNMVLTSIYWDYFLMNITLKAYAKLRSVTKMHLDMAFKEWYT